MTRAGRLDEGVHRYIFGYNLISHRMRSIRCQSSAMNFKMNNKHAIFFDRRNRRVYHIVAYLQVGVYHIVAYHDRNFTRKWTSGICRVRKLYRI